MDQLHVYIGQLEFKPIWFNVFWASKVVCYSTMKVDSSYFQHKAIVHILFFNLIILLNDTNQVFC